MRQSLVTALGSAALVLGSLAGPAWADQPEHPSHKAEQPSHKAEHASHHVPPEVFQNPCCEKTVYVVKKAESDPDHTMCRAGWPQEISRLACFSNTPRFCGAFVGGGGGGVCKKGSPRYISEGTWGWDYVGGRFLSHHVFLLWNHGLRYQAGLGAYKPDGPVFPPPPHVPEIRKHKQEEGGEE